LRLLCGFVLCCISVTIAPAQDQSQLASQNSISALLAEQPPQLQDGYLSDRDLWMLYDWRFDLLSNGAQQFLLRKYGYTETQQDAGGDSVAKAHQVLTPGAAPAPGTNIPVSQTFFRVGRRVQSETTIAVNGNNILVGFNDGDLREQAVAFSNDSGATWSGGRLPTYPDVLANSGDPVMAVGPGGRIYHAYLAGTAIGFTTIAVAYSDDGGATWNGPINASASLGGSASSLDKPWLAVDNMAGSAFRGNIYVTCSRFVATGQDSIVFMRSTDSGQTFSNSIALSTITAAQAVAFQDLQGSFISIGPAGEIYVAWWDSRVDGIQVVKSTDGGATFSAAVTALTGIGFGGSFYVPGTFDVATFGQMAVDTGTGPNRGAVYVTTNVFNPAKETLDILLARSGDGGKTWDAPVRVNNNTSATSQFQPALAVATNGNVGVSFYDRRNDPNDVLTDVYLAISTDGGKTFPTQQRVTTASSLTLPVSIGYRIGYHGDYNMIVASGNNFYLSWSDDRDGTEPTVFIAMIPTSGGLPDFNLSAGTPFADMLPGDTATFQINSSKSGLKLSAAVYPATGLTVRATGTTVTASSTSATAPGTYMVTVTGDDGAIQRSTEMRVTVHPASAGGVPTALTPTTEPGYNSDAAVDSRGNLHVVYGSAVINRRPKRITYQQYSPAGTLLMQRILYATNQLGMNDAVQEPHVAVGANGNIYVVWRKSDGRFDDVVLSRSTDGGQTFSAPKTLTYQTETISGLGTEAHAFQPSIAVGKNGTVFVSYLRENFVFSLLPLSRAIVRIDIGVIRSTDGGTTFSNVIVPTVYPSSAAGASVSTASTPALALDSKDNPYVVWAASISGRGTDMYLAASKDGGATFATAVNVSGYLSLNITPRQQAIAIGPNDAIYVTWNAIDSNTGLGDNHLRVSTDGQKFAAPKNVSNATYYTGALTDWPAVRTDSSGNVILAWREWINAPYKMNDTERDIFVAQCNNTVTSCTTPINISSDIGDTLLSGGGSGVIQRPALAVDAGGRVYVLYDDDSSGSTQVVMWTSSGIR